MNPDYKKQDIVNALKEIGITEGDNIFIHNNLGFYGVLEGCNSADDLCRIFLEAITEVITVKGTVVVPTFSYSYCHGEIYNPETSKTTCGLLAEYLIKNYPQNRTLDPNFSVCGFGPGFDDYLKCNIHESFGRDSFWEKFINNNGKFVCMNVNASSTFVHYIEHQKDVDYRYNKAFNGVTVVNGVEKKDYAVHYVFDGEDDYPCYPRMSEVSFEAGIVKKALLSRGTVLTFNAKEYYDLFYNLLDKRPRVLCNKE